MKSLVGIAKTREYEFEEVLKGVRQSLEPLGGMAAFVKPGQRVLLKPNMLAAFSPEKAVTTHPTIVKAVAMLAKEQGAKVLLGESPGIGEFSSVMRRCGIADVCEELDIEIADFKNTQEFDAPQNIVGKRMALAKGVAEADVIISLPKLKTHSQMTFTGALKNQYGLVVGPQKALYHYRLKTREWLAALMIDINRIAKPALAIMDAVVGHEGAGPSGGDPRFIGAILASSDLTALDVVACSIIGLDPLTVPLITAARRVNFGATTLDEIQVVGCDLQEVAVPDFKKVQELKSILRLLPLPQGFLNWLNRVIAPRPRIIVDRCIRCLACHKGCPVKPPAINPNLLPAQAVDDERCIRCYCCHEFCPVKAIELKRTIVSRIFHV